MKNLNPSRKGHKSGGIPFGRICLKVLGKRFRRNIDLTRQGSLLEKIHLRILKRGMRRKTTKNIGLKSYIPIARAIANIQRIIPKNILKKR